MSGVPNTIFPICDQPSAPAHIGHGSTVTYRVQLGRYLPPIVFAAAVMACISACAVTSFSFSVRLCDLAITLLLLTMIAPIGISSCSSAFLASCRAIRMKYSSLKMSIFILLWMVNAKLALF